MKMHVFARHGELVISRTSTKQALIRSEDLVLGGDSSGHTHTLLGACESHRDGDVTVIRLATESRIVHAKPDGHRDLVLPPGDYEIRTLRERGDGADRRVED